MDKSIKIRKVVYLDEQAVVDFLELSNKGTESVVMKRILETANGIGGELEVNKKFLGLLKLKLSGSGTRKRNNIIETQLTSSLISSFMEKVESEEGIITYIEKPQLTIFKDSATFYRNISPVLKMIEIDGLSEDERKDLKGIKINQIENTLDSVFGYYDMICANKFNSKKMIVRFNISGLRNNYTLNDLTKMDLHLYGIKIGECEDINLEFNHQIEIMTQGTENSNIGKDFDDEYDRVSYDIIDIIFAGI